METMQKVETITLTPVEKELFERCLMSHPYMDMKTWKKFRNEALASKDPKEKQFWLANGILTEEKPSWDDLRETASKN